MVLVTGSAGVLGRLMRSRLVCAGATLACVDIHRAGVECERQVEADITTPGNWADAFAGVDTVFHLAGKADSLPGSHRDASEYFKVNIEGTRNVLEAAKAHAVRRFVFFSSVKAMSREVDAAGVGVPPDRPMSESDAVDPDSPYGLSKLAAERLVLAGEYVPEPVVLRLCMVYGGSSTNNMQRMLEAVERHLFPPVPNVGNRRSMVHAEDVIEAAMLAASHPAAVGETFIVSDGEAYSTRRIFNAMCVALGRRLPGWSVPVWAFKALGLAGDAIGMVQGRRFVFDSDSVPKLLGSAWFSSGKIQQRLGYRVRWNLERTLPSMVASMRAGNRRDISPAA